MEIKKCPCCGGEANISRNSDYPRYSVKCINEQRNIRTPLCAAAYAAIQIWNNRNIEQQQNERVKYVHKCIEESGFEARCVNDKQGSDKKVYCACLTD